MPVVSQIQYVEQREPTGGFRACLAMLLGLRWDEVPDYADAPDMTQIQTWLVRNHQLQYLEIAADLPRVPAAHPMRVILGVQVEEHHMRTVIGLLGPDGSACVTHDPQPTGLQCVEPMPTILRYGFLVPAVALSQPIESEGVAATAALPAISAAEMLARDRLLLEELLEYVQRRDCPQCYLRGTVQLKTPPAEEEYYCCSCGFTVTTAEVAAIRQAVDPRRTELVTAFKAWSGARQEELSQAVATETAHWQNTYGDPQSAEVQERIAQTVALLQGEAPPAAAAGVSQVDEDLPTTADPELSVLLAAHNGTYGEWTQRLANLILRRGAKLVRKNIDYGNAVFESPIFAPDCPPATILRVRISDKLSRLLSLGIAEEAMIGEAVSETEFDVFGYNVLWACLREAQPIETIGLQARSYLHGLDQVLASRIAQLTVPTTDVSLPATDVGEP